jgi:hypothetical protein
MEQEGTRRSHAAVPNEEIVEILDAALKIDETSKKGVEKQ